MKYLNIFGLSCAQYTHISAAGINGLAELSCTVISMSKKSYLLFTDYLTLIWKFMAIGRRAYPKQLAFISFIKQSS